MKLQNILDLSTFEIVRFRVWNQTSQPSDKGLGSKYFNTNSGHEAYGREQIYTPIGWRTAAYMDDIDSINEKLDLIFGDEIDTDTIIDSWREVQDFLAGIEDTKTLMTMLDGKLDKSGGTITSPSHEALVINRTGGHVPYLSFSSDGVTLGRIGFDVTSNDLIASIKGVTQTLLHSGNIGDYALKTDGSNKMGASAYINWDTVQGNEDYSAYNDGIKLLGYNPTTGNYMGGIHVGTYYAWQIVRDGYIGAIRIRYYERPTSSWSSWKTIAFTDSDITGYAAGLKHSNGTVGATVVSSGRVDFSGNISLALGKSILDPNGRSIFMLDSGNCPQIGFDTTNLYSTYINGKDVYLRYGASRTAGLILNSSGNVTISSSDLAEENWRLVVDNGSFLLNGLQSANPTLGSRAKNAMVIGSANYGLQMWSLGNGSGHIQASSFTTATAYALNLNPLGGNVGIGTTTPQYKLDVAGDVGFSGLANLNGGALIPTGKKMMFGDASGNAIMEYDEDAGAIRVLGNLYATGTVASGGKAQAGSGTGGSATVYPFTLTYGQAAYQIANPKSNTNVIVQVYEWNATTSSWDLILTDVNVTASKITVTFGRTTTVNHMVTVV